MCKKHVFKKHLSTFKAVFSKNLLHKIDGKPFYAYYNAFSKEKWNTEQTLLEHPDKIHADSKVFLQIIQESTEKGIRHVFNLDKWDYQTP